MLYPYAELHCVSNFSFLRGASHPEELVERAHELGYAALAITDECSLAGVVRAHVAARTAKLPLIVGAEFSLRELWPGDGARRARGRHGSGAVELHDQRRAAAADDRQGQAVGHRRPHPQGRR